MQTRPGSPFQRIGCNALHQVSRLNGHLNHPALSKPLSLILAICSPFKLFGNGFHSGSILGKPRCPSPS